MPLAQVIEPDDTHHVARHLGGERGLVERRVVPLAAALDAVDLDAEGALERRDAAGRADQEPVRKALRDPEARAAEMVDHSLFLRGGRRVEGVELRLAQELAVARRGRILDIGQEGLEPLAVADIEAHHHAMPLAGRGAAEIDRVLQVGREGVGLAGRRQCRGGRDGGRQHEKRE